MYDNSRKLLKEGKGTIIDSAYNTFRRRKEVYGLANEFNVPVLIIECVCKEEIAKKRIQERPEKDELHTPPTKVDVYNRYKRTWEDVLEDLKLEENKHVSLIRYYSDENKVEYIKVDNKIIDFVNKIKEIIIK